MAWTAPRTYTNGEILTAAILNADLRDNMLALDQHTHSGAAGDGDDELTGVDHITHDDISDPAAPGASKTRIYTKSGEVYYRAGAAGAATKFSDVNHTHTFTEEDSGSNKNNSGSTSGSSARDHLDIGSSGSTYTSGTDTLNPTKASMIVAAGAYVGHSTPTDSYKHEIIIDGVVAATVSDPADQLLRTIIGSREVASGARTIEHKLTNNHASDNWRIFVENSGGVSVDGVAIII